MYLEVAEQKAEKQKRQSEMAPRERDYEKEQAERVEEIRQREQESNGRVRQCNEGKWDFIVDEETRPGFVVLDVAVQRHLDSSLIDVDVHPSWVSVVIKSKVLRLQLPAEVKVGESKAQRSKTTGHLVLVMPKVNPMENMVALRAAQRDRQRGKENQLQVGAGVRALSSGSEGLVAGGRVRRKEAQVSTLADEMLKASLLQQNQGASRAVDIHGIVKKGREEEGSSMTMKAVSSTSRHDVQGSGGGRGATVVDQTMDEDDVPPLV